jgi:hypothetical protein
MDVLTASDRVVLRALEAVSPQYDYVQMKGGWDQLTPILSLPPGVLRDVQNFEVAPTGGYARISGYERYDGQTKPSNAAYSLVQVTAFTNTPSTGQTLTGQTSGATGIIIAVSTSSLYVVLTRITGTFTTSEVVKVGSTTIGTATAQTVSLTALQNAQYLNLAADEYRALIGAVPGSGPIRGVAHCVFSGVDHIYAFRDNAGGTATVMYESSTSGWTAVSFFYEISFTAGGTATALDGDVLTQGGVTSTVRRVVLQSGAWSGTAAGRFIINAPAGGNFAAGAATSVGSGATVTISGVQTAITLSTGGRFEFERANFAGTLGSRRLYWVDGVNRGFEFDGTVAVPITTGTSTDTPKHLCEHKNFLFFAFQTSVIHSGPGLPYNWSSAGGASELQVGDTVTGLKRQPGNQDTAALEITALENTHILYGKSLATWNLVPFKEGVGAQHYSVQNIGRTYAMDANGLIDLHAVHEYGNFEQATLTWGIRTFISDKRSRVAYSTVCRQKSQYRIFFTDGTGLYVTLVNGKLLGSMQVVFPTAVYCAYTGQLANGDEVMLTGSASGGYVYEMDKGSSFDGASIEAYITFNWNSMKQPRTLKEFLKAALEIQGNFYAAFTFAYSLAYGDSTEQPQPASAEYESNLGSQAYWDGSGLNWDEFIWDGQTLIPSEVELVGCAVNMQVRLSSSTDYIYPFTVTSMMTRWAQAAQLR